MELQNLDHTYKKKKKRGGERGQGGTFAGC